MQPSVVNLFVNKAEMEEYGGVVFAKHGTRYYEVRGDIFLAPVVRPAMSWSVTMCWGIFFLPFFSHGAEKKMQKAKLKDGKKAEEPRRVKKTQTRIEWAWPGRN